MTKMMRIVEVMWTVIAAVSAFEVYNQWNINRDKAYIFVAFFLLAIFMYFLRRKGRINLERKQQESDSVK